MVWMLSLVFVLLFSGTAGAIHTQAHRESTLLAERVGYGRNTTGGAGGTLCTVTNLNDSGAGSLRNCLNVANQAAWVIFQTGLTGTIALQSPLVNGTSSVGPNYSNKTIDGRGATITISTVPSSTASVSPMLYISGMNNWIIHNVTLEPGNQQGYIIRCLNCQNIWYDHIDVTGGWNNLVSLGFGMGGGFFGTSSTPSTAITISWSKFRDLCHGLAINSTNCGSGMILFAQGSNDTTHAPAEPLMANARMTLHHNWYQHTSAVRHPYMRYGRAHAFNNYYDNPDQPVQDAYLGQFLSENDIFLCDQSVIDGYQCGQSNSGSTLRVRCTNFVGEGPGPGPGQAENCKVSGQWSVSGTETYEQVNPSTIFNPAADYSYTLETADAALRTKLQDTNTGTGRVPNPYNSVSATGPPTVMITGPTSAATYTTSATPLSPILSGTATDDVGVVSVTWACPTCTPTSGTATCATCGASATNVSWSVASIGLASGANVITVTATDTDSSTGTDTLTVTRSAPDVTTGLIAHYKFNDNASPATDSTGLGHSGTLVGTPAYVAGTTNMGRALSLNGTTQYVTTLDAANLDFTTAYTLAAWVNPPATLTGSNPLIVKNYQGTPGYYLYANITSSANCGSVNQIVGGHQPGQAGDACTTTTLPAGTWSHVAVTFDGTNTQLYVNGVASGLPRTPTAAAAAGTGTLDIGHSSWGEFLPATVDDVRVYNRALTSTDMAVLGVLPDISTGLRAHYKFNDAAGTATDSTGLGHTGTFQPGGATYGAGAPNLGNALALNGTSQYVSVADAADLDFTTAYTLTGWFFPTSAGAPNAGIVKPGPGTPQYAYYLYPRLSGICGTDAIVAGYSPSNQVCYATALTSNQWTHVGVTFANGSATTLYVGGIPVATGGATAPTVATAQALLLGNSQFSEFFAGRMDEIRLYNRELTAVDMNAVASVVDASNPPTVTITTDCGAGAGNNCTVSSATLTTFAGTATDDVGVPVGGITWTCPTCTPTSGTATCATCGPSATSVSWSVASITLASGTNVLTVTVLDADGQASTPPDSITITYTVVSSTVPTVLRLVR